MKVKESNVATIRVARQLPHARPQAVELNQVKGLIEARILANEKTVVVLETHPDAHYGRWWPPSTS